MHVPGVGFFLLGDIPSQFFRSGTQGMAGEVRSALIGSGGTFLLFPRNLDLLPTAADPTTTYTSTKRPDQAEEEQPRPAAPRRLTESPDAYYPYGVVSSSFQHTRQPLPLCRGGARDTPYSVAA